MANIRVVKSEIRRFCTRGELEQFHGIVGRVLSGNFGDFFLINKRSRKKVLEVSGGDPLEGRRTLVRVKYEDGRNSQMLLKNFLNNIDVQEWDKWDNIDEDEDEFDPDYWKRMGVRV